MDSTSKSPVSHGQREEYVKWAAVRLTNSGDGFVAFMGSRQTTVGYTG